MGTASRWRAAFTTREFLIGWMRLFRLRDCGFRDPNENYLTFKGHEKVCGSRTCKPNSVRRIAPAGRSFLWATHYCGAQATYPEVVTRRAGTPAWPKPRQFLPIWSCSVWGLPCLPHYCGSGALLPHLFTLTLALPPGRYILCGTFRQPGLNRASRTLSGTLLCGVRTFLPHSLTK